MYFASIVSFKMHPRNEQPVDLEACAKIADNMLRITLNRIRTTPTEDPWAGQQQQQ